MLESIEAEVIVRGLLRAGSATLQGVRRHAEIVVALVTVIGGLALAGAFWSEQDRLLTEALTEVRIDWNVGALNLEKRLELERDLLKMRFDGRGAIVQLLLGVFVAAGLVFTYRNMRTAQENARAAQENVRIATETLLTTQKNQLTERFTRAINQLGALEDGQPSIEVRLGGILALEAIARDSLEYRVTVVDVLSAYVRQNARRAPDDLEGDIKPLPEEISAALGVLQRLRAAFGPAVIPNLRRVDFRRRAILGLDLPGFDLSDARLEGASLSGSNLTDAILGGADFKGAFLFETDLTRAQLQFADLSGTLLQRAKLREAQLMGAKVLHANISEADLTGAILNVVDLTGSKLTNAILREADLSFANLTGVDLTAADLTGATVGVGDTKTATFDGAVLDDARLPQGFHDMLSISDLAMAAKQFPDNHEAAKP